MKEVCYCSAARCLIGDVLETACWEVRKENLALLARLSPDLFREISNGQVYRVGRLIAEQGYLSLVTGDYDGNNCCPWFVFFDCSLQ